MFTFVCWSLVSYAGICNGHGYPFFIGVTLGAVHLARFIARVDFENKESCDCSLIRCSWFGFWVWAGALADYVVKTQF
jgi:4-hydroxybenzoate polyprenyltransferase